MNKPTDLLALVEPPADADDPQDEASGFQEPVVLALGPSSTRLVGPGPALDDFDWSTDDSVVVKPRPGVAVYENKSGDVVVRVQNTDDPDDGDHFAYLSQEALWPVIKALTEYAPRKSKSNGRG
jgi:hypothetical protein